MNRTDDDVLADDLATCVSCGLCLPHCPTFRVTGEEGRSPRGRIAVIDRVERSGGRYDRETADLLNTCIQCRGCEPACPSGVPYGRIIETARRSLVEQGLSTRNRRTGLAMRWGLSLLGRRRTLSVLGRLVALVSKLRVLPGLGPLPVRLGGRITGRPETADVWLFTGCVMDVWMRGTHRNTAALVTALGQRYAVPAGLCCGALHLHAGRHADGEKMARRVMAAMPGSTPILVNSAGCGAALKEYGNLLGTDEARRFSARVFDIHEWLLPRLPALVARVRRVETAPHPVILQDPCHLRHVQKVHGAVRSVLEQVVPVVTLDDDGLCCGAGGAFSMLEPELAEAVRERKVGTIRAAMRTVSSEELVVASANPGCSMFLGGAGLVTRHPIDILADALGLGADDV